MKKQKAPKNTAYVVFRGRTPGIYETWAEVKAQCDHFSGSRYRGYKLYEEAIAQWDVFEQTDRIPPLLPPFNENEPMIAKVVPLTPAQTLKRFGHLMDEKARALLAAHSLPDGSGSHSTTCTAVACRYPNCSCP